MTLSHLPLGSQGLEALLSFSNFSLVGLLKVGRDPAEPLAPVVHCRRQGLQRQGRPQSLKALPADRRGSRPDLATTVPLSSQGGCSEVPVAHGERQEADW